MRARIFLAGLFLIAAACSRPAADPAIDEALDDRDESPDLALSAPSGTVPVASDLEVSQAEPAVRPESRIPTPQPAMPERTPEPLAGDPDGELDAAPASGVASMPAEPRAVDPEAPPEEAVSGPSEEGGGKPTDVSTGLGPVPDREWGDTGIIDDPHPMPGMPGTVGTIGRGGVVIIRGGNGGMEDDCKIHPRGGAVAGGIPADPGTLVNDRDPRRGALINERAPRTSRSPSLPRGGGFPRAGGFPRGGGIR